MDTYRIVCVSLAKADDSSSPIVMVGTGSDIGTADRHWYADQVVAAIRRGATFYTESDAGERAEVMPVITDGGWSLRSAPGTPPAAAIRKVRQCREWSTAMPGQPKVDRHPTR